MLPSVAESLTKTIGGYLAELRGSYGYRQDDIAAFARDLGLTWMRSTVAALESGNRSLSAEEFLLLPRIVGRILEQDLRLEDMIPDDDIVISIGGMEAHAQTLRQYLRGGQVGVTNVFSMYVPQLSTYSAARRHGSMHYTAEELALAARDANLEPVQRAARKFDAHPAKVAIAARRRWEQSFVDEREERVEERRPPDASDRSLRAIRGHVTRKLLTELKPVVLALKGPPERLLSRIKTKGPVTRDMLDAYNEWWSMVEEGADE